MRLCCPHAAKVGGGHISRPCLWVCPPLPRTGAVYLFLFPFSFLGPCVGVPTAATNCHDWSLVCFLFFSLSLGLVHTHMCVYICIHTCIHLHAHTHMCIHKHTNIPPRVCVCVCVCLCVCDREHGVHEGAQLVSDTSSSPRACTGGSFQGQFFSNKI